MFQLNLLDFNPPSLGNIHYLFAHEVAFRKYDRALLWMQDFLLHFTNRFPPPRLAADEANTKVKHLLLDPDLEPLSDHLLANQATALRLRAEVEQEPAIGQILVNKFVDTLESWQRDLSDARLTQNAQRLAHYYQSIPDPITTNPILAEVLVERARTCFQAGDLRSAFADYQRAIQLKPDFAQAFVDLGRVATAMGERQTALGYYNQAIELEPQNVEVHRLRGSLNSQLGNNEAARDDYNYVLSLGNIPFYPAPSRTPSELRSAIGNLTVLEAAQLKRDLEAFWDIQAATPPRVAAAEAEEQTEFSVVLTDSGAGKINVIKAVRSLTSLGLKEAKDLVEGNNAVIVAGVSKADAAAAKALLEAAGAKVQIQ